MKNLLAVGFSGIALAVSASEWYVDPTVPDDSHDGTSSNVVSATIGPKRTLAGVMAAGVGVDDGDTVWLLPGEHKEGTMNGGYTRLLISIPNLKVKSLSGNPANTAIVGYYGTGLDHSTSYTDPEAIACIKIATEATGCVIEGITLKDATARRVESKSPNERGGGIYDLSKSCWAINCVFTNCCAYSGGGMNGGNAARCRFIDCEAYGSNDGAAMESSGMAEYCMFLRCDGTTNARTVTGDNAVFVNCTFSGGKRAVFKGAGIRVYNSVVVGNLLSGKDANGAASGSTLYPTNSLFGPLGASTHLDEAETCLTDQTLDGLRFCYTASGDWRPLSTSTAATYGDAQYLHLVSLPAGYEHLDLDGRPVATEGPIAAGCCESVEQTGPTIKFGSDMEIEGVGTFRKNGYLYPTSALCLYRMRPLLAEGERTFCIAENDKRMGGYGTYRFPMRGEGDWVRVALAGGAETNFTLTAYKASDIRYVDAVNGNDGWDGTAPEHVAGTLTGPKLSLQDANNVATGSYPIVYAAPGVYSNGVAEVSDGGYVSKRRLCSTKPIAVIATEGAEKTLIVGEPDGDVAGGLGDGAIGGVYMSCSGPQLLQGFTITGCYSAGTSKGIQSGPAFCSNAQRAYLQDCIVSNNYATQGSTINYGVAQRTRFFDNESEKYVTRYANCFSCVFAGNRITGGNGTLAAYSYSFYGSFYNCTIDMRNALNPEGRYRGGQATSIYDSVFYGFLGTPADPDNWHDTLYSGNPLFADADGRDYRLGTCSPAIDAAAYSNLTLTAQALLPTDVDGRNLPVTDRNGQMWLGAVWNKPPLPLLVLGDGTVTESGLTGTNVVASADPVTVVAMRAATRPFHGFEVNGVLQPFTGTSVSVTPSADPAAVTTVKAVYGAEWYVDDATGDDGNTGATPDRAKATISAAATNAVSGDVIYVAKGVYGETEGRQKHASDAILETRVVVPSGVSLVADDPKETFIVGAASDAPQDDFGNGPNAVRCVYLNAGAVIRGFTLTGGHTYGLEDNVEDADVRGSAVLGVSAETCLVENCIVSNNASRAGTLRMTKNVKCRVIDNVGTTTAPAGSGCSWYGCIIDRNRGNATVGNPTVIDSCTFGTGNSNLPGVTTSPQILYYYQTAFPVYNSVFLYGRFYGYPCMTNCWLLSSMPADGNRIAENWCNCVTNENAAAAKVNADYTLQPDSPAIDRGDARLSFDPGGVDAFGIQRVMNGRIDIGASEWDWRPTYSELLGRNVAVEMVSPAVSNGNGVVTIPAGEISGVLTAEGNALAAFEITGNGKLSAWLDGALVGEFGKGTTEAVLGDAAAGSTFRFAYEPGESDTGCAYLRSFGPKKGLVLIVR